MTAFTASSSPAAALLLVHLISEANAGERSCSQIAKQLSAAGVRTVPRPFRRAGQTAGESGSRGFCFAAERQCVETGLRPGSGEP
jgi:hypothetical protein